MLTFESIMEQLKAAGVDTFMLPKKELKASSLKARQYVILYKECTVVA